MLKPSRAIFRLWVSLLIGLVFVNQAHASIAGNIFTNVTNRLSENVSFIFKEGSRNLDRGLADVAEFFWEGSERPVKKQPRVIIAKPIPVNQELGIKNQVTKASNPNPKIINSIPEAPKASGKTNAWTMLEQVQKNLQHVSQSISEQVDYNTEQTANLLDQIKSFFANLFTSDEEPVAQIPRVIIATPATKNQESGIKNQESVIPNSVSKIVQPALSATSPVPKSAVPIIPNSQFLIPDGLASLQQQISDLKQSTEASFKNSQQNQAYLSQISNLGPRGNTPLTISNPTITGDVTISGSLTVASCSGCGGGGSGSTNSGIEGYVTYYPGTGTTVDDTTSLFFDSNTARIGIGTSSPYGEFSIEADNTDATGVGSNTPIFVIGDSGSSTPIFYVSGNNGNIGIATDSPSVLLSVGGDALFGGNISLTGNLDLQGSCTGCGATPGGLDTQVQFNSGGSALGGDSGLLYSSTNLTVGGDLAVNGSDLNIGNGKSATSTISGQYGNLGFGTATPYGQVSIEAVQGVAGSNTPIFVVGDSGTTTPFIYVSGINGNVGIATDSPGAAFAVDGISTFANVLNVSAVGTSTFEGGLNIKTTGGLSSAAGLTISGGDIQSAGKITITSTGTSTLPAFTATDINTTSLTVSGSLDVTTLGTSSILALLSTNIGVTGLDVTGDINVPADSIQDTEVVDALTISGGTIDNTPIGNTTESTGIFTSIVSKTTIEAGTDISLYGSDLNIGNGITATSTISGQYGNLGFGSTTPFGQIAIEAVQGVVGSTTPIFVIGDQGSSSPSVYVSGANGGIGFFTDNPLTTQAVTVNSQLQIQDTNILAFGSSDGGYIQVSASAGIAGDLVFKLYESPSFIERFRIQNDGDVGVGTDTPGQKLSVAGGGLFKGNLGIEATSTASSFIATSTLSVGTTSPATASAALSVQGNSYITGGLGVGVATTSPGGLFVKGSADIYDGLIVRGGKVGIGTAAPSRFLTLSQTDTTVGPSVAQRAMIRVVNPSTTLGTGSGIQFGHDDVDAQTLVQISEVLTSVANQWTGDLAFLLKADTNATTLTEYMRIITGGNVGIARTSPTTLLDLGNAGDITARDLNLLGSDLNIGNGITATSTLSGQYGLLGFGTATPYGQVSIEAVQGVAGSNTPIFVVGDSGTSTSLLYISGNTGYTGIATDTPWGQLSVEILATGEEKLPSFVVADEGTSTPALAVYSSGVTVIEALETGAIAFDTDAGAISWIDLPVTSTAVQGTAESYTAQVDGANILTIYGESDGKGSVIRTRAGVGTTTPGGAFSVASATVTPAVLISQTETTGNAVLVQNSSGNQFIINGKGYVGVGPTSTPYGQFVIEATTNDSTDNASSTPIFAVGSSGGTNGSSTPFLYVSGGGFVGVGTASPQALLSIDNTDQLHNNSPALLVKAAGAGSGNIAIQVDAADVCQDDDVVADCTLNDLAELFRISEVMEAGDLAIIDPENPIRLKKATQDKRNFLAGAISTSPAIVFEGSGLKALGGGYNPDDDKLPLALSGRIPVKVNLEGGEIHIGDPITISSQPGIGTKAITAGKIIGYSLQNYSGPTEQNGGKIVILTNLENWSDPSSVIASDSEATSWVEKIWNALISKLTEWFQTAVVAIKQLNTEKLCVGSTCVNEAQLQALLQLQGNPSTNNLPPEPVEGQPTPDTESPVIQLNGLNPTEIEKGSVYSDLGAVVTDNVSQNLGYRVILSSVIASSSEAIYPNELVLDTSAPAEYTITYTATDQAGNIGTATRTVKVIDPNAVPVILNESEGSQPPTDSSAPPQNDSGTTSEPAPTTEPEPIPAP